MKGNPVQAMEVMKLIYIHYFNFHLISGFVFPIVFFAHSGNPAGSHA